MNASPKLILPVGNVGCGKSILSRRFVLGGAIRVSSDDMLDMLHGTPSTYIPAMRDVYHQAEDDLIAGALMRGFDVYIDRTNVNAQTRSRFIELARFVSQKREHHSKGERVRVLVYDFGEGNDQDVERRKRDPRGIAPVKWDRIFGQFRQAYQRPKLDEGIDKIVTVDNSRFHSFAFDFDGVIVENKFPDIGPVNERVVAAMRGLWNDPHNLIIVYTCREDRVAGQYDALGFRLDLTTANLAAIADCMREHRIPCDFLNCNPWFGPSGRKMFAHYYVDDRNATLDEIEAML